MCNGHQEGLFTQVLPVLGTLLGVGLGAWLGFYFSKRQSLTTNKKEE